MNTHKTLKDLVEQEKQPGRNPQAEKDGTTAQQQPDGGSSVPKNQTGAVADGSKPARTVQSGIRQETTAPQSDLVSQAQALLQQQMSQKPGAFQSAYRDQLQEMADQILNQKPFSYDVNADALYQQMVDQFARQGKLAMMDTMGQAQTMTGGYGNSYAQTAGQQVYAEHMQRANEQLPQFYGMALDRYDREQEALRDQYAMLLGQEEQDYGRYRDQLSDYYAQLDRLRDQYSEERAYEYQKDRDDIADKQWQAEMDESIRQFNHIHGIGQETAGDGAAGGSAGSGSEGPSDYELWMQWLKEQEAGGDQEQDAGIGLEENRQAEIEKWVASSLANVNSPSFSLDKLIKGTSFLQSQEERDYATAVGKYIAGIS